MGERIHEVVRAAAVRTPDAPALVFDGHTSSFAELDRAIAAVAAAVEADTEPGDRVAVLAWNNADYVALLYGVPAAGRLVVPLNARLSTTELVAQLQEAEVAVLVVADELRHLVAARLGEVPSLRRVVGFGAEFAAWLAAADGPPRTVGASTDPAWLIFTSGTTGRAKGALLSHDSLIAVIDTVARARPVRPDDVYLYPFPLFHVSAHNILVQHRYGRPVVLVRAFAAGEVLDTIAAHGVTTTSLAPTMIAMLLDHPGFTPESIATLRCIGYGASAIPLALLQRIMATSDVGLSHSYGMTEASGGLAYLTEADHRRAATTDPQLLRSTGRPITGVEVRIVDDDLRDVAPGDVGEIAVKGAQVMSGYWRQPELTAQVIVDGWLRTGDLGRFDADGYLYVVDRKKDIIITGGENVSSREVEDTIDSLDGVKTSAVVGTPDPDWGESVFAFVVLAPSARLDEAEVIAHCRANLAGYKRPKHVAFVDELPVNANGKIDKRVLRERARSMKERTPI